MVTWQTQLTTYFIPNITIPSCKPRCLTVLIFLLCLTPLMYSTSRDALPLDINIKKQLWIKDFIC